MASHTFYVRAEDLEMFRRAARAAGGNTALVSEAVREWAQSRGLLDEASDNLATVSIVVLNSDGTQQAYTGALREVKLSDESSI